MRFCYEGTVRILLPQGHHVFTQAQPQKALVPVRRYKRYLSSSLLVFHKEIVWHINSTSWIVIRIPRRRQIVNNVRVLLEAACYTLSTEQSCYRVADLYSYIEWGWCWWTKKRLTLKTLWPLVCLFLHCWHSFLRSVDNVLKHRKTTPELWRVMRWWFY